MQYEGKKFDAFYIFILFFSHQHHNIATINEAKALLMNMCLNTVQFTQIDAIGITNTIYVTASVQYAMYIMYVMHAISALSIIHS